MTRKGILYLADFPNENRSLDRVSRFDRFRLDTESSQALMRRATLTVDRIFPTTKSEPQPRSVTIILGPPGCGKTQISAAIADKTRDLGRMSLC